ncbi:MAG: hypothetical protein KH005_05100 [Clostridium sp.]|nr:hypothetical protein [Clostridium sp.]
MKKVLKGILAMVVFYIFNMFIMQIIGHFIFIGDSVTISYHLFTYTGLMTLSAVIIVCTSIIIDKLNEVKNELDKTKNT